MIPMRFRQLCLFSSWDQGALHKAAKYDLSLTNKAPINSYTNQIIPHWSHEVNIGKGGRHAVDPERDGQLFAIMAKWFDPSDIARRQSRAGGLIFDGCGDASGRMLWDRAVTEFSSSNGVSATTVDSLCRYHDSHMKLRANEAKSEFRNKGLDEIVRKMCKQVRYARVVVNATREYAALNFQKDDPVTYAALTNGLWYNLFKPFFEMFVTKPLQALSLPPARLLPGPASTLSTPLFSTVASTFVATPVGAFFYYT
jgi:hypothetical protein